MQSPLCGGQLDFNIQRYLQYANKTKPFVS